MGKCCCFAYGEMIEMAFLQAEVIIEKNKNSREMSWGMFVRWL